MQQGWEWKIVLVPVVNIIRHEFRAKWSAVFGSRPTKSSCTRTRLCPPRSQCTHDTHLQVHWPKLDWRERGKDKIQLIGCSMHASARGGVRSRALDTQQRGPVWRGDDVTSWDPSAAYWGRLKRVSTGNKQKWRTWSMEALLLSTHSFSFILLSCYSVALFALSVQRSPPGPRMLMQKGRSKLSKLNWKDGFGHRVCAEAHSISLSKKRTTEHQRD